MRTFCFECKHDCHCGRKCDQCSCYICNNIVIKTYEDYMGGNKKLIKEFQDGLRKIHLRKIPIDKVDQIFQSLAKI